MTGMFDDLVPKQTAAPASGMFSDLIPQTPAATPAAPRFDTLHQNPEFLQRASRFFGKEMPQDEAGQKALVEEYVSNRRWVDNNLFSSLRELSDATDADRQRLEDMAYLRKTWDDLPNMFSEGGRPIMEALPANVGRALADPISVGLSLLSGGTAGQLVARGAVKPLVGLGIAAAADGAINVAQDLVRQNTDIEVGNAKEVDPLSLGIAAATGVAANFIPTAVGGAVGYVQGKRATAAVPNILDDKLANAPAYTQQAVAKVRETFIPSGETGTYLLFNENTRQYLPTTYTNIADAQAAAAQTPGVVVRDQIGDGRGFVDRVKDSIANFLDSSTSQYNFVESPEYKMILRSQYGGSAQAITQLEQQIDADRQMLKQLDAQIKATPKGNKQQLAQLRAQKVQVNQNLQSLQGQLNKAQENLHLDQSVASLNEMSPHVALKSSMSYNNALEPMINGSEVMGQGRISTQVIFTEQGWKEIEGSTALADVFDDLMREADAVKAGYGASARETFGQYFFAKRLLEAEIGLNRKGQINTGIDVAAWREFVDTVEKDQTMGPLFQKYSTRLQQWNSNYMDTLVSLEYISREQADRLLKSNSFYLPINRLAREGNIKDVFDEAVNGGAGNLFKLMEGVNQRNGGFQFKDPVHEYMRNIESTFRAAVYNQNVLRTARAVELMEKNGIGRHFAGLGGTADDLKKLGTDRIVKTGAGGLIKYKDNGVNKVLRVVDRDMFDTFNWTMDTLLGGKAPDTEFGAAFRNILEFGQRATSTFQRLITQSLPFSVGTSLPTDTIATALTSKTWKPVDMPILNSIYGASQIFTANPTVREAYLNGALSGGLQASTRRANVEKIFGRSAPTGNIIQRGLKRTNEGLETAADAFGRIGVPNSNINQSGVADLIEMAPRQAMFKKYRDTGMTPAQAAYRANQENIDFRTRGATWLNDTLSLIPFGNATKNAMFRFGQSVGDGPGQARGKLAMGTAALVTLSLYQMQDERYMALPEEDRFLYFNFWLGDKHIRIRKEENLALMAATIENYIIKSMEGDDATDAAASSFKYFVNKLTAPYYSDNARDGSQGPLGIISPYIPYPLQPFVQVAGNVGYNGPIVPKWMEGMDPRDQYYEGRTSNVARAVGDALNVSPIKLEYLARGLAGPPAEWALFAERLTDADTRANIRPEDVPLVKRFYRGEAPPRRTSYTDEFYDTNEKVTKRVGAIRQLETSGRDDALNKFDVSIDPSTAISERGKERRAKAGAEFERAEEFSKEFRKVRDELSEMRKEVRQIWNDPTLTPTEKRKLADEIQREINRLTQTIMLEYKAARPGLNEETRKLFERRLEQVEER